MSERFLIFAGGFQQSRLFEMEKDIPTLIIIWFLTLVAFFALWAILLKVVKRISEKKRPKQTAQENTDEEKDHPITPTDV